MLTACNPLNRASATPTANHEETALMQAVRHYYQVLNQVRASGDISLIDSVTDPDGVDRSNVQAFMADQRAKGRLSIITADVFSKWRFTIDGRVATVSFDHQISGYDIDAATRQPVESPTTLMPTHMVMELRHHDSGWLVFNRQTIPNVS
jgi:hypothetical protein